MNKTKMLKKNYEFKRVLNKGKYYTGHCVEAFIKKEKNSENNFLGLAVSTKIGKAVKRNKIKRLIREAYSNIESEINTGYSIVFLWKKNREYHEAKYKNVSNDINKIMINSGILGDKSEKNMHKND